MRVLPEVENTYHDIFVKIPEVSYFEKLFAKIESLDEIFKVIEDLYFENEKLKEQIKEKD